MVAHLPTGPLPQFGRPRPLLESPSKSPVPAAVITSCLPTFQDWTAKVAMYWDWENIHASLYDQKFGRGAYGNSAFGRQESLVQVQAVMAYASSLGEIAINRAYADWSFLRPYKSQVLSHAIELIQLFHPGPNAKNGADIRIVLDAMLDTQHYHLSHVVIVGGDSDYIGLVQKLRNTGTFIVGIGVEGSTNPHWKRSCSEFIYYGSLIQSKKTKMAAHLPNGSNSQGSPSKANLLLSEGGA